MSLTLDDVKAWCAREDKALIVTPAKTLVFVDGKCAEAKLQEFAREVVHQEKQVRHGS